MAPDTLLRLAYGANVLILTPVVASLIVSNAPAGVAAALNPGAAA